MRPPLFQRLAISVELAPGPPPPAPADVLGSVLPFGKGVWVSLRIRRWALPFLAWEAVVGPLWAKPAAFLWAVWAFWLCRRGLEAPR